jgi:tetratricopeptide (TPR) repeat protein
MRFRFLERFAPSARTQRRFEKIGGGVFTWVGYPFRLLFGLAKMLGQMVASWWESRNLRYLLQGLPAFILAIALLVVGALVFFQDRAALAQEYESLGARALMEAKQKNSLGMDAKAAIALAQTCYKRLSPAQAPENMYHMAETYELQRQYGAAVSIYDSLAPLDPKKKGYGPAHYQVAMRLLASKPNPRQIFEAENHLVQAYQYAQTRNDRQEAWYASLAHAALFEVLRDTNRPEAAEQEMVTAVREIGDQVPKFRLTLAAWYMSTGKRDAAEEQAKRAVDTLTRRVEENINDVEARGWLIESLKFSAQVKCFRGDFKKGKDDFARARELCQRGMAMTTDPAVQQKYLTVLCYMFIAQFDNTMNDPNTSAEERFALLETALGLRPNDMQLIQRLGVFMTQSGPESKKAREVLQKMIDEGKNLSVAHMILGTAAWEKNDVTTAKYHWEKAFEQTDWSPRVANNLGWLLAFHSKPPDLERALMLVDAALQKQNFPEYHGTRGHILSKMGRNREALPELELAKPAFINHPRELYQLYKKLAEVTKALDMAGESQRYDKLADELLKAAQAARASGPPGPIPIPEPSTPAAADPKAPAGAPAADAPKP